MYWYFQNIWSPNNLSSCYWLYDTLLFLHLLHFSILYQVYETSFSNHYFVFYFIANHYRCVAYKWLQFSHYSVSLLTTFQFTWLVWDIIWTALDIAISWKTYCRWQENRIRWMMSIGTAVGYEWFWSLRSSVNKFVLLLILCP